MNDEQRQRLLNVAKALRESPKPKMFDMDIYLHDCGTPACAFGHYAAREDLQDAFKLRITDKERRFIWSSEMPCGIGSVHHLTPLVLRHFGITDSQSRELFNGTCDDDVSGCDGATTVEDAALYFEDFVARRS